MVAFVPRREPSLISEQPRQLNTCPVKRTVCLTNRRENSTHHLSPNSARRFGRSPRHRARHTASLCVRDSPHGAFVRDKNTTGSHRATAISETQVSRLKSVLDKLPRVTYIVHPMELQSTSETRHVVDFDRRGGLNVFQGGNRFSLAFFFSFSFIYLRISLSLPNTTYTRRYTSLSISFSAFLSHSLPLYPRLSVCAPFVFHSNILQTANLLLHFVPMLPRFISTSRSLQQGRIFGRAISTAETRSYLGWFSGCLCKQLGRGIARGRVCILDAH